MKIPEYGPGPIVLFGSGETSPSGRRIFDQLFSKLPTNARVALLETPAGFEQNSEQVATRIADFICRHLQNYHPRIEIIPARNRKTTYSPDNEEIAAPILESDLIFAGPGSPTYTVRQLRDSLTWYYLLARHRLGGALAFSSAAVIALSIQALPVYEIYKVGEDPHWKPGLDFFSPYGLPLVFIPHWNNKDGGEDLDTSHCFMGKERFEQMLDLLPADQIVVGIDEHTALWFDCRDQSCHVSGLGNITILQDGVQRVLAEGDSVPFSDLMDCQKLDPSEGIPNELWEIAINKTREVNDNPPFPPNEVLKLMNLRQDARTEKRWGEADDIRAQIEALGWEVRDTPDGPVATMRN